MQDDVLQTIVDTVTRSLGQVDTVARDRKRLERATGCCTVDVPTHQEVAVRLHAHP
jgi:hypothetical protein